MAAGLVKLSIRDQTATVVLNRPEKRNALSRALLADLSQALDDLHLERRVRAVVLTGAGTAFCAGMDLGEMRETAKLERPHDQWREDAVLYQELLTQMLNFPKPLIAAVNGPAVAGGAGLVLGCDIVLAAEEAQFGLPEPRRGIVAGLVTPILVFRIGAGHAARLLLTGALLNDHELLKADHLWPRAHEVAAECARCAPEALQLTKRMLNETVGEQLTTQLAAGAAVSATARTTEAAQEGLNAFLEKREPKWL
jgi:enoyl-CoA hydratase/carnithine racemase